MPVNIKNKKTHPKKGTSFARGTTLVRKKKSFSPYRYNGNKPIAATYLHCNSS